MDEETGLKAKELLLRSKIYRFVALLFAVFGFVVFAYLYARHFEGDLHQALTSLSVIPIILIPFLPAIVLSWMAAQSEKKLVKLLEKEAAKKK